MQTGRAAVIGASGGIGASCMLAFTALGWETIGADIVPDGGLIALDVTDGEAMEAFAAGLGQVDAMVYAAGTVATMPIAKTDFAVWRRVMAVNLDGAAHAASAFAKAMARTGGAMVFVSSAAGLRGESNASAYSASKAGLIGMVESIAAELVPKDIRVNAVAPGNVDTPMLREVARGIAVAEGREVTEVWERLARTGAANRILTPAEVARVCASLCTDAFSGVTGTTIPVDAGYLLT
ncbi:MAG: SDR family oxidoreductase [Rhodobacter sp.]|nr:SDR family oxidoreductase [Rhodobacter sp.]MCY4168673.1 SDR family oxidoreductase [Rhodobacter sp.]MCY4241745.1 SDR family oxidoreductase [Rhodobacter sp.]